MQLDEPRPFNNKDNRGDRNYGNRNDRGGMRRDRDGRNYGRDGPRRDYNSSNEMRRDDMREKEPRESREPIRRDLPKYAENTGPVILNSN